MKLFLIILACILFLPTLNGQNYLIKNPEWKLKIGQNASFAPLFFGVAKVDKVLEEVTQKTNELSKFKTKEVAYKQELRNGWNYFTIGKLDSAILHFNQAYIIDKENLETFVAIGSIITYIDGEPNFELIKNFDLDKKISSTWGLIAFFGNRLVINELKELHKTQLVNAPLSQILKMNKEPYKVDTLGNIMLKLQYDNHEGYFILGIPNGKWIDYYDSSRKAVMRNYEMQNGQEVGLITAFHKNGKLSAIFTKNNDGKIEGEFKVYDYNGELVRIEHWHNSSSNSNETKVIREWEENGRTTFTLINDKMVELVWLNGKKVKKK